MAYRRRIVDDVLDEAFPRLAAIALEGPKGVGKTATASQRAKTTFALDDPRQREALMADIDHLTRVRPPALIDEWQLEPSVWDRVRQAVDADSTGGRFILAGSAMAAPDARIHSGTGRIVSIPMRPLSFYERGIEQPTVSLRGLLDGARPTVEGTSEVDLPAYTDEILRSGFPGLRDLPERARELQLSSYVTRIVERELPENGLTVRRPGALTAWLTAYAAATSTDAAYSAILDAATAGDDDKPARQTVGIYREHLQRVFVLDPVSAWVPTFAPLGRLTHAPKHHLVDPALAARLVGVGKAGLLRGDGTRVSASTGTWLGALFESLVAQSVRVYADAVDARIGHLRTRNTHHEINLIVEAPDRRVVAIEVKLSATVTDRDVRHLHWLEDQIGDRLADRVVVTSGPYAYRRPDGVAVVPLSLLGP